MSETIRMTLDDLLSTLTLNDVDFLREGVRDTRHAVIVLAEQHHQWHVSRRPLSPDSLAPAIESVALRSPPDAIDAERDTLPGQARHFHT